MKPASFLLREPARADKACLRAEAVRACLHVAGKYAQHYGLGEGIGVLQIALAIAEQNTELRPGQSNEVLREIRRSVAESMRRLGDEAPAVDIALELDLLGDS